jgi:hypothetical protein
MKAVTLIETVLKDKAFRPDGSHLKFIVCGQILLGCLYIREDKPIYGKADAVANWANGKTQYLYIVE